MKLPGTLLPMEACIKAVLESPLSDGRALERSEIEAAAVESCDPEAVRDHLSITLCALISRGMLVRRHAAPYKLVYEPTPDFERPETLLLDLMPYHKPRRRFRKNVKNPRVPRPGQQQAVLLAEERAN